VSVVVAHTGLEEGLQGFERHT